MNFSQQDWTLVNPDESNYRLFLANFWLSAPLDQLEFLWSSPFGKYTSSIVSSLNPESSFSNDEVELRNSIGDYFNSHGLNDPLVPRLMIANFLFSPPGLLKINNASDYFPSWLFKVYVDLYEPSANAVSEVSTTQQNQDRSVPSNPAPQPDKINFGPFPDTLLDLTSNRLHLNRILGLSNLHYIDPDDEEIAIELL